MFLKGLLFRVFKSCDCVCGKGLNIHIISVYLVSRTFENKSQVFSSGITSTADCQTQQMLEGNLLGLEGNQKPSLLQRKYPYRRLSNSANAERRSALP